MTIVHLRMRKYVGSRLNTHNPLPPIDEKEYINLAPFRASEALEAYDRWNDRKKVPQKLQELMMVLEVELSNYKRRMAQSVTT